jgi:hypothetical protein
VSLKNSNEECVSIHQNLPLLSAAPCHSLFSPQDCFTDGGGDNFEPSDAIEFNRYAQNNNDGISAIQLCQTEFRNGCDGLAYVVRHPGYNGDVFDGNDVALIFLPVGQQITDIDPVRLNRNRDVPASGQNLEVFGWGLTSNDPDIIPAIEIQTATMQALTNQACRNRFVGTEGRITNDMLCAKSEGVSAAPGDSGT